MDFEVVVVEGSVQSAVLKAWHGELGGLFVAIGNLRQEEENP